MLDIYLALWVSAGVLPERGRDERDRDPGRVAVRPGQPPVRDIRGRRRGAEGRGAGGRQRHRPRGRAARRGIRRAGAQPVHGGGPGALGGGQGAHHRARHRWPGAARRDLPGAGGGAAAAVRGGRWTAGCRRRGPTTSTSTPPSTTPLTWAGSSGPAPSR